jgi:hypothetical protein
MRNHRSLIEASSLLTFVMKRNGNNSRRLVQWILALNVREQINQLTTNMWLAFKQQHESAQCPFVNAAGASNRECVCFATVATNLFTLFRSNAAHRQRTTLPAYSFVSRKYLRRLPTPFTSDAERSRLDTMAANSAGLRIQQRKAGVVN